jgi:anthranilate phosphoribosyltransferase
MPVRKALGIRTVFNLLGPLVNPCAPEYQVMGVYQSELCVPVAQVLGLLGCKAALVVHGKGLDEVAIHGSTTAALYKNGKVTELILSPEQAGLSIFPLEQIRGGEATENATAITRLLKGDGEEAHKAIVAINAGALAWVFGKTDDLKEGAKAAMEAIDSGNSFERLVRFRELSHGA